MSKYEKHIHRSLSKLFDKIYTFKYLFNFSKGMINRHKNKTKIISMKTYAASKIKRHIFKYFLVIVLIFLRKSKKFHFLIISILLN